jgi:hypothetical protein
MLLSCQKNCYLYSVLHHPLQNISKSELKKFDLFSSKLIRSNTFNLLINFCLYFVTNEVYKSVLKL